MSIERILLKFSQKYKKIREDLSAVVLSPDKHLWLATDETTTLERLSMIDEHNFADHQRFHLENYVDLLSEAEQEIDIEGLDYWDNYLWLVGSHSLARKSAKKSKTDIENLERLSTIESNKNRYLLARIPLVNGELYRNIKHPEQDRELTAARLKKSNNGNLLIDALLTDPHLGLFIQANIPSKDNGLDIEGLAVYQNRIFLGLRGPVLRGWAIILEIEVEECEPNRLKLKKQNAQQYKKHFVDLSGLGVRELCWDNGDLLILAGPTMDLDGPVKLFKLSDALNLPENTLHRPEMVLYIPYGEKEDHAEGMTLFNDIKGKRSLLVVYDSPAKQTRLENETGVYADVLQF